MYQGVLRVGSLLQDMPRRSNAGHAPQEKKTLTHRRTRLSDFPIIFPGNSESEKQVLRESFILKLFDPPLLVRICFTTYT